MDLTQYKVSEEPSHNPELSKMFDPVAKLVQERYDYWARRTDAILGQDLYTVVYKVERSKVFNSRSEAIQWIKDHINAEQDLVGLYKASKEPLKWTKTGTRKETRLESQEVDVDEFEWTE